MTSQLSKCLTNLPWVRIGVLLVVYWLFLAQALIMLDPDFGWHLQSGRYFIQHGIPATDVFTYTAADFPWVNHEWLSDILVALVYEVGAFGLLAAVYAGIWTTAIAIAGRHAHPVLLLAAACALLPLAGVRALTWSVLALVLLMLLLNQSNRRWRYLIPVLFLAWANMHGSFLIGFAYGGWQMLKERSWGLLAIGLVALLMTFVTPYGYHLYGEVFQTMLDSSLRSRIAEWASLALPLGSVAYSMIWVSMLVLRHGRDWRQYIRFDVLMFGLSVASLRMMPLFVVLSLPYLASDIWAVARQLQADKVPAAAQRRLKLFGIWAVAIGVPLMMMVELLPSGNKVEPVEFPDQAVAYLSSKPCDGNLFNAYNFGGYLIWKLPSHKVYIDGRMPSWRHEGVKYMDNYLQIRDDASYRKQQFEQYDIRCVLVENTARLADELRRDGWRVPVDSGNSSLLMAP